MVSDEVITFLEHDVGNTVRPWGLIGGQFAYYLLYLTASMRQWVGYRLWVVKRGLIDSRYLQRKREEDFSEYFGFILVIVDFYVSASVILDSNGRDSWESTIPYWVLQIFFSGPD